jgi:hypothetical protein
VGDSGRSGVVVAGRSAWVHIVQDGKGDLLERHVESVVLRNVLKCGSCSIGGVEREVWMREGVADDAALYMMRRGRREKVQEQSRFKHR